MFVVVKVLLKKKYTDFHSHIVIITNTLTFTWMDLLVHLHTHIPSLWHTFTPSLSHKTFKFSLKQDLLLSTHFMNIALLKTRKEEEKQSALKEKK